jgi:hypothetical protein|nr:MAG TPA: minor structural protein [Caudoviricetes sp.]
MSLYDSLRKALTPELFTQVTDALGDDFDYDQVPRSRLNKVINQRNELRDQLSGASQPHSSSSSGHESDEGEKQKATEQLDVEALKAQWLKEQGDAVRDVKIQYAALDKLRAAGAIDADLIWAAGLIDKSKIQQDAAGNFTGLDEIIADLTTNRKNLFVTQQQAAPSGTGKQSGEDSGFATVASREDFLKLSYEDQMKFKAANPEVFRGWLS